MQNALLRKLESYPIIIKILLLAVVYWLFCWMGTLTIYRDFGIAIYWPAAGVAILGIYIFGVTASPGIFITSFIINLFIYKTGYESQIGLFLSIAAISAGNTIAAIVGSQCLKIKVLKNNRSFFRLDSILNFILFVVVIPSLISSFTGGIATYYSGVMPDFFVKTQSWLLADLIGVLIIVPFLFAWLESPNIVINRKKIFEFSLIIFFLGISGYLIFTDFFGNYIYNFLIAYFTTPIYLWLSLRFDSKTVTTVGVFSLVYISFLVAYSGNDYLGTLVEKPYVLLQGFSILITALIILVHSVFNERQQSLLSLQMGEEKYRLLFENTPVSLWENDYSEAKKQIDSWSEDVRNDFLQTFKIDKGLHKELISKIKILDMNRSSLDLYEESNKEILGQKVSDIFSSGDTESFSSVLASFYLGKSNLEERNMEVKIKRKTHFFSVRWLIMPGHENDLSRILVTVVNITDLKKAEKEIRLLNQRLEKKVASRTEELNRTNQELEAFSYSVSHDLKAPLRAIRGFSSLLLDEFGNDLQIGAYHYIKNIEQNSIKMTNLVNDLLQFSRLGRKSLRYTEINTQKLVNTIWEDLTSLKKLPNIEFIVNPLPDIIADESLITQVFVNLFSNAIKYSKADSPGRIELSCKTYSEFNEFSINDQGIGFDQKHAEKIFKVFQRLHTQDEYEGTGVGLALAQRIVHRHGGNIYAVSESGKGTTIFFTLPVEIDSELYEGSKKS